MFEERGELPIGIVGCGHQGTNYILRALRVRDTLAVRKSPDAARAAGDEELMGLVLLASRLEIEGVPKEALTLDAMLDLYDEDLAEILEADGRLREQMARFRGKSAPAVDPDAAEDRPALGAGALDGARESPAVDRGLAGDQ
ncbi:MAG: hypothetical protein HY911_04520 [Desulfobacterales bacterium]|nr:hypothetical protein [Desulfobacterales bacterium]